MKKILMISICFLSGCTSLTYTEKMALDHLKAEGITLKTPVGGFEEPASLGAAGGLNLLPGVGNFYLASGNGADKDHYLYGFGNFLTWPLSIIWAVPEGIIDAGTINEKEFVRYYMYHPAGKSALAQRGLILTPEGLLRQTGYASYGYPYPSSGQGYDARQRQLYRAYGY